MSAYGAAARCRRPPANRTGQRLAAERPPAKSAKAVTGSGVAIEAGGGRARVMENLLPAFRPAPRTRGLVRAHAAAAAPPPAEVAAAAAAAKSRGPLLCREYLRRQRDVEAVWRRLDRAGAEEIRAGTSGAQPFFFGELSGEENDDNTSINDGTSQVEGKHDGEDASTDVPGKGVDCDGPSFCYSSDEGDDEGRESNREEDVLLARRAAVRPHFGGLTIVRGPPSPLGLPASSPFRGASSLQLSTQGSVGDLGGQLTVVRPPSSLIESFNESKRVTAALGPGSSTQAPVEAPGSEAPGEIEVVAPSVQVVNASPAPHICSVFRMIDRHGAKRMEPAELSSGRALFGGERASSKPAPALETGSCVTFVMHPRLGGDAGADPTLLASSKLWAPRVGAPRSQADSCPLLVEFRNTSASRTATVYWVDYDGELVERQALAPGDSYVEGTFATHPWLVVLGRVRRHGSRNELLLVLHGKAGHGGRMVGPRDGRHATKASTFHTQETVTWVPRQDSLSIVPRTHLLTSEDPLPPPDVSLLIS